MTALVKLSNSSFWGFMFVCVLFFLFFCVFWFLLLFLFVWFFFFPDNYLPYLQYIWAQVSRRQKGDKLLNHWRKKKWEDLQNLISHENDVQIWRSYYALVFKSVEPIYRHSKWKIQWLKPVAMVTNGST